MKFLDYFEAIDSMEKEYNELQKDELYPIFNKEDNTFKVLSINTHQDDLSDFEEYLIYYGLLNQEGNLRFQLKLLQLKPQFLKTTKVFVCVLTGTWSNTDIEINDEVQIFGNFSKDNLSILIKNNFDQETSILSQNFLVVEPHFLLHPTAITASLVCPRKGVLTSYIGGREDVSLPLIKGYYFLT